MKQIITIAFLLQVLTAGAQVSNQIRINQLGFYEYAPKIAILTGDTTSSSFFIVTAQTADTVFSGQLSGVMQSANSSLKTRVIDFSGLTNRDDTS